MSEKEIDATSGTETTGHEWDGIKELNTPMPKWWLYTFYATVVWAAVYCVLYPAWPLVTTTTQGVLGYSSRADVAKDIETAKAAQSEFLDQIKASSLEDIRSNGRTSSSSPLPAAGPPSRSTAPSATAPAPPDRAATPTSMTTTGSGAARSMRFTRPSPMASGSTRMRTRASAICRPLAVMKSSSPSRSRMC